MYQDNAALESYMFTAYTLKYEIYTGTNCFSILTHSKDWLSANRRSEGAENTNKKTQLL